MEDEQTDPIVDLLDLLDDDEILDLLFSEEEEEEEEVEDVNHQHEQIIPVDR